MTSNDLGKMMERSGVNINTIVGVVSLVVIFSGIVAVWTQMRFQVQEFREWQEEHLEVHANVDQTRVAQFAQINTQIANINSTASVMRTDLDQYIYRTGQLEKVVENASDRVSRIAESYSNQFTGITTKLGAMEIQIALALDALKRIERTDRIETRENRTRMPQ